MAIKVLGISGSPRRQATLFLVETALEACREAGAETELIALAGKKINHCLHCDRCLRSGNLYCPAHEDDMRQYYEAILAADAYLIGTPVYQMNISGLLANFLNRWRPLWAAIKEGALLNKTGGAIAVGGERNGGQEFALAALNNFFLLYGITPITPGQPAYNGVAAWNHDRGRAGAEEDAAGVSLASKMGTRLVEVTEKLRRVDEKKLGE
ncbi:flavodoxin family protein [Moorella naiadis]|uniref:flavodoxin family protein n=1 Tax=Moorella naiadis (nom. illeg.) TaxID=3093670 RepID=UPI003D9CADBF